MAAAGWAEVLAAPSAFAAAFGLGLAAGLLLAALSVLAAGFLAGSCAVDRPEDSATPPAIAQTEEGGQAL